MAIAASHSLDMPRQQAFWLLHLGGWGAYFAQGCLYAVAHGKPSGYWIVPFTAACTGFVATLGLRQLLRACWSLPFKDDSNRVLGTFGIYYHHCASPSNEDIALVTEFTRLAGLAVQQQCNY